MVRIKSGFIGERAIILPIPIVDEFKNTDFLNWFKFPCTCQAESKPMHRPNARAHSLVRLSGVEARFCSLTELLEGWGTSTPLSVAEGCVE